MNLFRKRYALALCAVLPVLLLSSCAHRRQPDATTVTVKQIVPLTLPQKISSSGVQIIQQGARLQMVLPIDKFFRLQTTQIKPHQIRTLKRIAAYLKGYLQDYHVKPVITVAGFTDTVYTKRKRYQLSHQYADVVASYLWRQGFSHKQLRVQGFGATDPIANPKTAIGAGFNRRVVIQVN